MPHFVRRWSIGGFPTGPLASFWSFFVTNLGAFQWLRIPCFAGAAPFDSGNLAHAGAPLRASAQRDLVDLASRVAQIKKGGYDRLGRIPLNISDFHQSRTCYDDTTRAATFPDRNLEIAPKIIRPQFDAHLRRHFENNPCNNAPSTHCIQCRPQPRKVAPRRTVHHAHDCAAASRTGLARSEAKNGPQAPCCCLPSVSFSRWEAPVNSSQIGLR